MQPSRDTFKMRIVEKYYHGLFQNISFTFVIPYAPIPVGLLGSKGNAIP